MTDSSEKNNSELSNQGKNDKQGEQAKHQHTVKYSYMS